MLIAGAAGVPLHATGSSGALLTLSSPLRNLSWGDGYTFIMVGVIGVLLLGAHHADEAGRGRFALALLGATVAALVGPLAILGIILVASWYAVFLGLPIAGLVVLVRHLRRRRT